MNRSKERKRLRMRICWVACCFTMALGLVAAKAVYLQIYCGPQLSRRAASQYVGSLQSQGNRGTIYDVRHRAMAVSIETASIAADPSRITDKSAAASELVKALDLDGRRLGRSLAGDRSFVWIKRSATPKEIRLVRDLQLSGIDFVPEYKRFYPSKTLAAQVLGFSGIDGRGLEGIEYYYDAYLKAGQGKLTILRDALGRVFEAPVKGLSHFDGNNLILTLDRTVQFVTEAALAEAVTEYRARSGIAIVMKSGSGALLAMAHYPFFNPNSFAEFKREQWRNRAITDPFEPGSTMKIFGAAGALEYGGCTPSTLFFCENGQYRIGANVVHDTKPRGWLSLKQVITYSSNIGAVKLAERLGPETLHRNLENFGFGCKTGIDCPGETTGSLADYQRWSRIDTAAITFGQGISVSAIQLITAAAAIANDGILMKPYMVQAITNKHGRLIKSFGPVRVRRAISSETARQVRRMMQKVVTDGTGVKASLDGYSACGKTGTAQKIDGQGTYAKGKYVSSFVGFAPVESSAQIPGVTILVVIDEPLKHHYGGVVAAPVFRKIAQATLNYLNVSPAAQSEGWTAGLEPEGCG